MFSKISIEKIMKNAQDRYINKESVEDFYKFLLTNIISEMTEFEILSGQGNPENVLKKCGPILDQYKFYDMLVPLDEYDIFSQFKDKIEENTLYKLGVKKIILKKEEAYDLLKNLEEIYTQEFYKEILSQDREECLQTFYIFAGILSNINFNHRYWSNSGHIDRNKMNLISELLARNYKEDKYGFDSFFGEVKKTIELSIHYILNTNEEFKNNKQLNFPKICVYASLLVTVREYRLMLFEIYTGNGYLEVDGRLFLSKNKVDEINSLMRKNVEVIYPTNREESEQIYDLFYEEYGFSPKFLENYLINYPEKILDTSTIINFIEDKLLIMDIKNKTGQSEKDIKNMLEELSLSPVSNQKYYEESFNSINRLFRTPLIKVENYYILSNWLLLESVQYLKYRILKKQLSFDVSKEISNAITDKFDEFELRTLNGLIRKNMLIGDINFSLNKNPVCKHLFENKKNLPQEIDFFVIKDKNLYIMEMKNNDLRRDLKGIKKDIENAKRGKSSYLAKLINLKNTIFQNKNIMEKTFHSEFNNIHLFLAFNNPHYMQGYDFESGVTFCSVDEFTMYVNKYLCST
ncbi:hypothetical protein HED34_03740 [Vagococcus fluvialis]|uniref:hypothetical protein n=1 Tax=Vagococcus fluvialis TaxID=2738 RepID=UPI001432A2CF|nr:hypothetical protein [Vagococcus fluvialis]NKC59073.1 hypothetical protein [Vagococcus fluvialis]NKD49828.1 hypothetical protein [Vagococcus fluvialis]